MIPLIGVLAVGILVGGVIPILVAYELYKYHRNKRFPKGPPAGWRPVRRNPSMMQQTPTRWDQLSELDAVVLGYLGTVMPQPRTRWARLRHRISRLGRHRRR